MNDKLTTIMFTQGGKAISPVLTTAREYGRWLETLYESCVCDKELYVRQHVGEDIVLARHPGTLIGGYFDRNEFSNCKFMSWYVDQDSTMMTKLKNMKLAKDWDVPPVMGGQKKGRRLLRLYSIDQIRLYIQTNIDRKFDINGKFAEPRKITLRKCDMSKIEMPAFRSSKKSLLDTVPVTMTLEDVEKKLGYKIAIISQEENK